jgi:hypothetical protein
VRRKNLVPKLILEPVYLVSEQTIKLTAETIAEDNRYNDIIKNMKFNLLELKKEENNHPLVRGWFEKKKYYVLTWANAKAGKTDIGTRKKPKDSICAEISQEIRDECDYQEYDARWIRECLPPEYKRESMVRENSGGYAANISPDLDEVITIGFKDIDSYEPDELVDYVQKADGVEKLLKDRFKTKLNNLELNKEHAEEIIKQKGIPYTPITPQKKGVESTIPPDPEKGKSWNACIEVFNALNENKYIESWLKLANKIEKYPPGEMINGEMVLTKEDDVEIARFLMAKKQSIVSESRMLASFIDDKYAFSLWRWCKVIVDEDDYGKHAAAVKNKVNPKQGPGGPGVTKKPRPLTRERVGDTKGNYWDYMKDQADAMGYDCWWKGVAEIWDEQYHAPYNADRRNRESPKLSETAFGSSSDEE